MRRKLAMLVGNNIMGAGMMLLVANIAVSVLNQLPQIYISNLMDSCGIMCIFVGALLWFAGARMGRSRGNLRQILVARSFDL